MNGGYKQTPEEWREVRDYWKKYHIRPKKVWYKMYCDGREKLDPRYIPLSLWYTRFLPYYNNTIMGRAYVDKCAYDIIYKGLKMPRTIIKNCAGRYYDGQQRMLTREEAIDLCCAEEEFIAKCATASSGGHGIQVFLPGEISHEKVEALFDDMGQNFVVQELIKQHKDLARINESSLNTLRVMSFFFNDEVHILSAQLRIGSAGARVDNYSSGGFACNVMEDGRLSARAVSRDGWATQHPNGTVFKDFVVPEFAKVIEVVKQEHKKLPYLNIIGWDFAVDRDGEPVFIELNEGPQDNQNGSGPTFGDMTEAVLEDVFIRKSKADMFS